MNCLKCKKGKLAKQLTPFTRRGVFVGNFKAEVCENCGEKLFGAKEAEKIEEKLKEMGLWGSRQKARMHTLNHYIAGLQPG